MSVLRIDGASLECVEKVIRHLEDIGNIERFSVFSENIPEPYKDVSNCYISHGQRNEIKTAYSLILECLDSDQEVWIEGAACGYSGTGPNCTIEILQILGVRMDFKRIISEKWIQNEEVVLEHDLNLIIRQRNKDQEDADLNNEKLIKVMMKFKNPFDKWKSKEMLKMIGCIQPLRLFGGNEAESYYFRVPYHTVQEMSKHTTSNVLTLHERLENIDVEHLNNLIQQIGYEHNAEMTSRIYERAPQ
ncbi:hypothetical protein [Paenibacillus spongiae]|uniref:Uncharacterized protein n=1 Tax=Paenibacillus spongiae TaxID=2909671 RepID=A0ABY5SDG7_9BACL|nr:hypothetical protein [Paenibacillus spongiae]UVI32004.1 hypothetical protein L1F29_09390 [Paenibacillus spongiae]